MENQWHRLQSCPDWGEGAESGKRPEVRRQKSLCAAEWWVRGVGVEPSQKEMGNRGERGGVRVLNEEITKGWKLDEDFLLLAWGLITQILLQLNTSCMPVPKLWIECCNIYNLQVALSCQSIKNDDLLLFYLCNSNILAFLSWEFLAYWHRFKHHCF